MTKEEQRVDLVKMPHHTTLYGIVTKVAGFYHLIGLHEKIAILKVDRRSDGDDEDGYEIDLREVAIGKRGQWRRKEFETVPLPCTIGGPPRSVGYDRAKLTRVRGGFVPSRPSQIPWQLNHPNAIARMSKWRMIPGLRRISTLGCKR